MKLLKMLSGGSLACEIGRDAPLTWFERIAGTLAAVSPVLGLLTVSLLCRFE